MRCCLANVRAILLSGLAAGLMFPIDLHAQTVPVTCQRLAGYDLNRDGKVNASDPAWATMQLEVSRSQTTTLSNAGVREIDGRCATYRRADGTIGTVLSDPQTGQLRLELTAGVWAALTAEEEEPSRSTRLVQPPPGSSVDLSLNWVTCTRLEQLDSNRDGALNALDPAWASLRLFHDRNGDGVREAAELSTVGDSNVQTINCTGFISTRGARGTVRTDRQTGALVLVLSADVEAWLLSQ